MNHYHLQDLSVGMEQKLEFTITSEIMDRFRSITNDENPLHRDREYAAQNGYSDVVAYGMLTASFLSTIAGVYLPGEKSLIHSVEVKFLQPVYQNESVTLTAKIDEINTTFSFILLKFVMRNAQDQKVCKGKMQVGLRP